MKRGAALRDIVEFGLAVLSRVLVTPLTWIIPRDPKQYVVLGRVDGRFMDNGKYFAAWVEKNAPDIDITFVTMAPEVVDELGALSRSRGGEQATQAAQRVHVLMGVVDDQEAGPLPAVDFRLLAPLVQRLQRAADLGRDRRHSRPARRMLARVIQYHPDRAGPNLG